MRIIKTIFFILLLVILLFGCTQNNSTSINNVASNNEPVKQNEIASNNSVSEQSQVKSDNTVKEFVIHASSFKLTPTQITVKKGDRVKIIYVSDDIGHNLVIDGYNLRTNVVTKGSSDVIEFTADKQGTFTMYCSVGSHRSLGMEAKLIVE